MVAKPAATSVPVEPFELGTSEVLPVPDLMTHTDYNLQFEDWLAHEREIQRKHFRSKPFIGDRSYRHFDGRVNLADLESNSSKIIPCLRNPRSLEKYSFLPFVRRDKKVRRFTRELNTKTGKKEVVIKQKIRPIMYASHTDACVYGFYAYMLKNQYDTRIKKLELENSIIAYRKIPRDDGSNRNKSNIDFAKDIYDTLGNLESAAVLSIDIKDFFGSMDHVLIGQKWAKLLGLNELPLGHKIVFQNITKYRYLFLYEAMEALGLGRLFKGRFIYAPKVRRHGMIAYPKQFNSTLNNANYIHKNRTPKGIPQGSPISDIIANFYLLEFDQSTSAYLAQYDQTLYKRYSDDILIVCPQQNAKPIYEHLNALLEQQGLQVNERKTELFFIDRAARTLSDQTGLLVPGYTKNKNTIQYLGFEFDLNDIHIRSGTIANHYRKLLRIMKSVVSKPNPPSKKKKRKLSKRDRYGYIKLSSSRMNSDRLRNQHINVRKRAAKLRKQNKQ